MTGGARLEDMRVFTLCTEIGCSEDTVKSVNFMHRSFLLVAGQLSLRRNLKTATGFLLTSLILNWFYS